MYKCIRLRAHRAPGCTYTHTDCVVGSAFHFFSIHTNNMHTVQTATVCTDYIQYLILVYTAYISKTALLDYEQWAGFLLDTPTALL
jgi:hypothetical protein